MKLKRVIIGIFLCLFVASFTMGITDCNDVNREKTADQVQANATKKLLSEAQRQVGMPNIVNFQQRKLMKMIQELCDQADLVTYTYIKSEYTGKLIFLGKSIGYGVPFSAQFTNPMRIVDTEVEGGVANKVQDAGEVQVLPQADPNGLFMPTSSSATWVMLVNPDDNKPYPVYVESEITVSPFKLKNGVEK
jgi:hypothetical protein